MSGYVCGLCWYECWSSDLITHFNISSLASLLFFSGVILWLSTVFTVAKRPSVHLSVSSGILSKWLNVSWKSFHHLITPTLYFLNSDVVTPNSNLKHRWTVEVWALLWHGEVSLVRLRPVWMTNHPPSVLWRCWLGHQTCKRSSLKMT